MYKSQMKQVCRKCKGTGTTNKQLVDRDGVIVLCDPYHDSSDKNRPQFENCRECHGAGTAMYSTPAEVLVEGVKVKLEESERRARFNDVIAS